MAITFGAVGATADGTSSLSVAYPSGITSGQMLLLEVASKGDTIGTPAHASTPSGWTFLAQGFAGVGYEGASDSGSVAIDFFTRVADGSETGSLSVTITAGTSAQGTISRYSRSGGSGWLVAAAVGSWTTDNTNPISVTFGSDPGLTADDMVVIGLALNNNSSTGINSESLTIPGATAGTRTQQVFTSSGTGRDQSIYLGTGTVSSGTSSGAATWEGSKSTTAQGEGPAILVRLREDAGGASLDVDAAPVALSGSVSVSGDIQVGTSFDVAAAAVSLSGALALAGDIQITEAPELDLDPATLALAGALAVSGDIEIGTSHDIAADPLALSGALAVSGDIEASVDPVLDIDAAAIALSGSLAVSGDIDIGTTFDLAAAPVALAGSLALAGDVEASDTPVQSGILEIEWEPNLWWKRKPKALPEKVVREKLKKAATVIAKKAEEQVKADVVAEKEQRKAEAREAVRPMLAEMPGFDWQALYDEAYSRALNAAVAQAMREQEAMAQAKAAIDRARLLDDEDVEILMALL